jgi:NTE family protein
MRRGRVPAFLLLSAIATSCAYRATTPLKTYDLEQGYRFEKLPRDAASVPDASKNSDELFVILAFSGGGTRAAALSYGVLRQLHEVRFGWDPEAKAPCDPSAAGCSGPVRSLLDEVDVISSVSGGSFTSAYYALHGTEMFDPKSRFQTAFLYHPVQGDLFTHAIFRPNNWNRLLSRVEIAAQMYSDRIFSGATFKDLMSRPRPYVVINAADM